MLGGVAGYGRDRLDAASPINPPTKSAK